MRSSAGAAPSVRPSLSFDKDSLQIVSAKGDRFGGPDEKWRTVFRPHGHETRATRANASATGIRGWFTPARARSQRLPRDDRPQSNIGCVGRRDPSTCRCRQARPDTLERFDMRSISLEDWTNASADRRAATGSKLLQRDRLGRDKQLAHLKRVS